MIITLIPKSVAVVGYKFTHLGGAEVCEQCKLKNVCVDSLKTNQAYEVKKVRNKEHECLIDGSKMVVCDVEECNLIISVFNKKIMENVIITRPKIDCAEILCENYDKCLPTGVEKETKVKIVRVLGSLKCPLGYDLVEIEAKMMK